MIWFFALEENAMPGGSTSRRRSSQVAAGRYFDLARPERSRREPPQQADRYPRQIPKLRSAWLTIYVNYIFNLIFCNSVEKTSRWNCFPRERTWSARLDGPPPLMSKLISQPRGWRWWLARNKPAVVIAVPCGTPSRSEAHERYNLCEDELSHGRKPSVTTA